MYKGQLYHRNGESIGGLTLYKSLTTSPYLSNASREECWTFFQGPCVFQWEVGHLPHGYLLTYPQPSAAMLFQLRGQQQHTVSWQTARLGLPSPSPQYLPAFLISETMLPGWNEANPLVGSQSGQRHLVVINEDCLQSTWKWWANHDLLAVSMVVWHFLKRMLAEFEDEGLLGLVSESMKQPCVCVTFCSAQQALWQKDGGLRFRGGACLWYD